MDWEETHDDISEDEPNEAEKEKSFERDIEQVSFWQMLRRFFFQTNAEKRVEQHQRLQDLNLALANNPEVAANYMLRGEIRLEQKHYELARDDFLEAIRLAEAQFEGDGWGLAAQVVMDRAREGLRHTMRYLE
jgi:cytochrome c-type biogenesis protein CcmH/NrfG